VWIGASKGRSGEAGERLKNRAIESGRAIANGARPAEQAHIEANVVIVP
jgi:hypothetical protein